ncbi:MAG: hypothetical protein HRU03_08485 [Nanoarchaeales archaeon]|nr:hypothetical protein [Nanoarchaeales archaeon]
MTSETIHTNQPTQLEIDHTYNEYVKKAVQEGLEDIKTGRVQDFDTAMAELDEEFKENE